MPTGIYKKTKSGYWKGKKRPYISPEKNPFSLQSILNNTIKAQRQKQMKTSPQFTLGEIILKLEAIKNKKLPVIFDIKKYHPIGIDSWRGSYCELALEYSTSAEVLSLAEFTKILKDTIGKTLTGYKEGDFLMGKTTPVWVANYGESKGFRKSKDLNDTAVIDVIEDKNAVIIKTKAIDY